MHRRFYKEGYTAGFEHGALHGTFEGRALGLTKSFEIWEELGFIQGQAQVWLDVMSVKADDAKASRCGSFHSRPLVVLTRCVGLENKRKGS